MPAGSTVPFTVGGVMSPRFQTKLLQPGLVLDCERAQPFGGEGVLSPAAGARDGLVAVEHAVGRKRSRRYTQTRVQALEILQHQVVEHG